MDENFRCNMCVFSSTSFQAFRNHYVRTHQHDPNFSVTCCIDACAYTTKNWGTFRSHLSRKHRGVNVHNMAPANDSDDSDSDFLDEVRNSEDFDKGRFNAMFTLSLQAEHNLSEAAVDAVVASTSTLLDVHVGALRDQLKQKLDERHIDPTIIDDIPVEHLLNRFDTASKRQSHFENCMPYVNPKEVILGGEYITKNGILSKKDHVAYIIPFQQSLEKLLELPEVWHCVQHPHFSDMDEFMFDICDGEYIRRHPLFRRNPQALQIVINTDDLEIVNPLGSHVKKHKITIFYYTLTNIPPQFRSRLTAIQLLAIAKTKHARVDNGLDKLLADFIETVNRLSGGGINMHLHDAMHTIEGALIIVPADTLAAHWLGGFKEGVSFALRNCRHCDVSGDTLASKYTASGYTERNHDTHVERCSQLEILSKRSRIYWSKIWGINGSSCLLKINDFPLSNGLVQDPMHVLLEGVVRRELANVLNTFIYEYHYFSLRWLNTAIVGFPYSYLHSSTRPEPLEKKQIDGTASIKQTSSATLTLVQLLPIMIGNQVPENDERWVNYLRLLQIVLLCTSSYCSHDTSALLGILVALYLQDFRRLYPHDSFIPKMHYMLHFPRQMKMYGPTRHHWCMRFEGKHGFFKTKKYRNFMNLPYSMAKQHQLNMCFKQTGHQQERSTNFLYEGDIVGQGDVLVLNERYPAVYNLFCELVHAEVHNVYAATFASIHGLKYKKECALVVSYDGFIPSFVLLKDIVIYEQEKIFIVESATSMYNQHIASYTLEPTGHLKVVPFLDLKFKWPLSVYRYNGQIVVMNSESHCCEIF